MIETVRGEERVPAAVSERAVLRPGITIGIAAYNEQDVLLKTVREVLGALEGMGLDAEILLIDDASQDGTAACCRQAMTFSPIVRAFRNDANLGFGGVYFRGAALAAHTWYMMLPGDNGVDSRSIRRMLQAVGTADLILAYTLNPEFRGAGRRLLSRVFTWIVNRISGHHVRYYNGPVICRTAHVGALKGITSSFAFYAEIICRMLERGCSVAEVGVTRQEDPRRRTSAFRMKNLIGVAWTLVRLAGRTLVRPGAGMRTSTVEQTG